MNITPVRIADVERDFMQRPLLGEAVEAEIINGSLNATLVVGKGTIIEISCYDGKMNVWSASGHVQNGVAEPSLGIQVPLEVNPNQPGNIPDVIKVGRLDPNNPAGVELPLNVGDKAVSRGQLLLGLCRDTNGKLVVLNIFGADAGNGVGIKNIDSIGRVYYIGKPPTIWHANYPTYSAIPGSEFAGYNHASNPNQSVSTIMG